jgi:hypothetical protein
VREVIDLARGVVAGAAVADGQGRAGRRCATVLSGRSARH